MNRKRKKDKNPDGTNPSNGLYEHPSVVAARRRKDANTPGGAPKGSKPPSKPRTTKRPEQGRGLATEVRTLLWMFLQSIGFLFLIAILPAIVIATVMGLLAPVP